MALSVTFTNFAGELVYESRSGTPSLYVPDTLGSTAQLWSDAGVKTDEWVYWPYGEVRTRTGTTNTPFTFVGILGYYLDILGSMIYVRARSLRQALARWQTVDPLWPVEKAFEYVRSRPVDTRDPAGLTGCSDCYALCLLYTANVFEACLFVVGVLALLLGAACGLLCPINALLCIACYVALAIYLIALGIACFNAMLANVKCCNRVLLCCDTPGLCFPGLDCFPGWPGMQSCGSSNGSLGGS